LLRLDLQNLARESFLTARSSIIKQRASQLSFDGSVVQYAKELSVVVFTLIRNTAKWYFKSFKDPSMASAFMKWVKAEVELFAELFRKRVFFEQQKFHVVSSSVKCVFDQCQIMREVGLEMRFMVERLFFKNIGDALDVYVRICVDSYPNSWRRLIPIRNPIQVGNDTTYRISNTTQKFYDLILDFERDVRLLADLVLYDRIVNSFIVLMDGFIKSIVTFLSMDEIEDDRFFLLLGNMRFVLDFMIPYVSSQLADIFGRPISEIQSLRKGAFKHHMGLVKLYADARAQTMYNEFNFNEKAYASEKGDYDIPSERMQMFIRRLNSIALKVSDSPIDCEAVIIQLLTRFFTNMNDSQGSKMFGFAGVQRLVLDIHFVLKVCEIYVTDECATAANSVCEMALRGYFAQHKDNVEQLQSAEWYSERVDDNVKTLGTVFQKFGQA